MNLVKVVKHCRSFEYPVSCRLPVRLKGELEQREDECDAQTSDQDVEDAGNVAQRQGVLSRAAALQQRTMYVVEVRFYLGQRRCAPACTYTWRV